MGAGEYAELDLLQTLERGLSNAYTLFHSVDWSRGSKTQEQHGEIDIVVLNQAGDVLLMEVKSGSRCACCAMPMPLAKKPPTSASAS